MPALVLAIAALTACWAHSASANPGLSVFMRMPPYEWQGDCRLCHQESVGKAGTATQPFAEALKDRGLGASSTGSELKAVLDDFDDQDSDRDGRSDIEELLSGSDPNRGKGQKALKAIEYRYGCLNLGGAATDPASNLAMLGAIVGLVWARRARRARSSRSPLRHRF